MRIRGNSSDSKCNSTDLSIGLKYSVNFSWSYANESACTLPPSDEDCPEYLLEHYLDQLYIANESL